MSKADSKPKPRPAKKRGFKVFKIKASKKGKIPVDSRYAVKGRLNRDTLTGAITGVESSNASLVVASVKQGLHYGAVEQLETALKVSTKRASEMLSIPVSTLTRRKKEGVLKPDESDRVVRYATLFDAAVDLFEGDAPAASTWLAQPQEILGGESPIEHATTEIGAREVSSLIGRLQHGVFS